MCIRDSGTVAASNNTIDLGASAVRFKDIYIAGGIDFGAASTTAVSQSNVSSASNLLDEYEEGQWTPTLTTPAGSMGLNSNMDTLSYTKIGKAMRAVRDSNELANVSGINSDNIILFTWISSSMLAGLAGIFQAIINDVRYNMGFLILLLIFAGTVLGGIGTSFGAMVGGLLIGIFVQVSVALPFMEGHTEAKNAVALAIMILILLFRPQGIFGEKERVS